MTDAGAPGAASVRAYSDAEYVFEPHTAEMPAVRPYLQGLWDRRAFIAEMARAQIRGKRSSTIAGQLWAVLDPIFQAALYFLLITVIRGGNRGTSEIVALVFCVFLFNVTSVALNDGGRSIVSNRALMLNSNFPRAVLPLTAIYKGLFNLVPSMGIYAILHLALGQPIGPGIATLPLLLGIQTVLNTGLALLIATVTVFVRDMTQLLTYINRLLLFTTPVIYAPDFLSPTLQKVLSINPFFALFSCYRLVLAGGMPSSGLVLQAMAWAAFFFFLGARVFLSHEHTFAIRL